MSEWVSRYCERDGPGWFAEPLNTASGLAFFVSAWQLWRQLDRSVWRSEWDLHLLAVSVALVGIATMLWHGSGVDGLLWLDAAAIALFAMLYWIVFLLRTQAWGTLQASVVWVVSVVLAFVLLNALPLAALGGTLAYTPFLLMLLAALGLAFRVDRRLARDLLLANVILWVGLSVRAMDAPLCSWVVVGTHWFWQLLLAILLFVLVDGLFRHQRLRVAQNERGGPNGASGISGSAVSNSGPAGAALADPGVADSGTVDSGTTGSEDEGSGTAGSVLADPGVADSGTVDSGTTDSEDEGSGTTGSGLAGSEVTDSGTGASTPSSVVRK